MGNENRTVTTRAWAAFVGLTPLLVFSNGLLIGLVLGMTFLVVHSTASAVALLVPVSFGQRRIFAFSMAGAMIASSVCATLIRIIDPLLFESSFTRVFLAAYTVPVFNAAVVPSSMADRERAWENMARGLGYGSAIVLVGLVRELMASGGVSIAQATNPSVFLPVMAQPAGAMVLLGLAAAGFRVATSRGVDR
ncbi:MAG TPA: Rnf-Nqr domain containing protein [bacterium]|nr:Rnf-Nqr domain containing protein [bacterium]